MKAIVAELPDLAIGPFVEALRSGSSASAPRPRRPRSRLTEDLAEKGGFRFELGPCHVLGGLPSGDLPLPNLEESVSQVLRKAGVSRAEAGPLVSDAEHVARFFSDVVGVPDPELRLGIVSRDDPLPTDRSRLGMVAQYPLAGPFTRGAPRVLVAREGSSILADGRAPSKPQLLLEVFSREAPWFDAETPRSADIESSPAEVALVMMPFGPLLHPSLGLSLLRETIPSRTSRLLYFNIDFARIIGPQLYQWLSLGHPVDTLSGEWVFASALHREAALPAEDYLSEVLGDVDPALVGDVLTARRAVEPFLEACLDELRRLEPKLVGFTSTFQQHIPSLALAKRIFESMPDVSIVIGGANCEGPMGRATAMAYPFLDAVVSGEGEPVFPTLVDRLIDGESVVTLPGVSTSNPLSHHQPQVQVENMDLVPTPNFADFFSKWKASPELSRWPSAPLFESARGCWWGERRHCTFCGLNGDSMKFRSKSADRVLNELCTLVETHQPAFVQVVDNILDMSYFEDLLPQIERKAWPVRFFYETKANLKKHHIRQLRAAGVLSIQPGIESLSDPILRLMQKGVRALHCIQMMKWCEEAGVDVHWNFLWGFPGEPEKAYEDMATMVPKLHHLRPPGGYGAIRLDRFSPNFEAPATHGVGRRRPWASYRYLHAGKEAFVENLACYFDFVPEDGRDPDTYTHSFVEALERWQLSYAGSSVCYVDKGKKGLLVSDTREVATKRIQVLSGLEREIFLACDEAQPIARLHRRFGDKASVSQAVDQLEADQLILRIGESVLTLATQLVV